MPPLRHTFARCRLTPDHVLLDQRDLLEVIGESASGEQARQLAPATTAWRNRGADMEGPRRVDQRFAPRRHWGRKV